MNDINIPKENEGFIYTILSFERNVEIKCNTDCYYIKEKKYFQDCPYQLTVGNGKTKSKFTADKLVLNVKNIGGHEGWRFESNEVLLVDGEGFIHEGQFMCLNNLPANYSGERQELLPQTQMNFILLFYSLPPNVNVSRFKINIYNKWTDFILQEFDESVSSLFNAVKKKEKVIEYDEKGEKKHISNTYLDSDLKYNLERLEKRLLDLKVKLFSRFHNVLTPGEKTKLDNKITSEIYALDLELKEKQEAEYNKVKVNFTAIKDEYTRKCRMAEKKKI